MQKQIEDTKTLESIYRRVREILETARSSAYRAVNLAMVQAYWHIGKVIVEEEQRGKAKAEYGEYLLKNLSQRLTKDFGKGFDYSNVKNMRQFYMAFPIGDALRSQLNWTHYRLLMRVEKESVRNFYIEECIAGNWSTRQLERQINSFYYERILSSRDKKAVRKEIHKLEPSLKPEDIIKDPYVLEFLNVKENIRFLEKDLEKALIEKLQEFLLELGKGFSFAGRQQRISADGDNFYIDLVFYNYLLKCFVLIDLKIGKLTHQDIGQMDFYVRYYENKIRTETDNPTIGIILCSEKNETVVKYSVLNENKRLFASKYKLYLPTEKELKEELEREKRIIEMELNLLKSKSKKREGKE
ncbi:MAG: PDDEXK nuclease domain-containing protein [Nitrospirota bacterium]|nr:PDDEXK nuclease domain-containing protein [Nitrospirota bacterium]